MKTFANIDSTYAQKESAKILLKSIAYDGTSTWGKGSDKAFPAFLEASNNMELYDIETDSEVFKHGIYLDDELSYFESPEDMYHQVYNNTAQLLQTNKFLTFFGGEHSISIGIIKAFREHFGKLTVLHIDAHADLRSTYNGSKFNHACAMYNASQTCNLIQVGIRSMDAEEKKVMDLQKVHYAHDQLQNENWINNVINQLTDHVYITFDLDAFDPSIMPATGTPEPGGLKWYETLTFLRKVFNETNVVGFDIVELCPISGLSHPQFLAAKLYYKMLSYKFKPLKKQS